MNRNVVSGNRQSEKDSPNCKESGSNKDQLSPDSHGWTSSKSDNTWGATIEPKVEDTKHTSDPQYTQDSWGTVGHEECVQSQTNDGSGWETAVDTWGNDNATAQSTTNVTSEW
jgi:hypothetical protein